jgi:hypothetical protein
LTQTLRFDTNSESIRRECIDLGIPASWMLTFVTVLAFVPTLSPQGDAIKKIVDELTYLPWVVGPPGPIGGYGSCTELGVADRFIVRG